MLVRILSILLVFSGTGCVAIPVEHPYFASSMVGPDGSDARLRPGHATRHEIENWLGLPFCQTLDNLVTGHLFKTKVRTQKGLLLDRRGFYFGSRDEYVSDHLWLEYEEHGILQTYERGVHTSGEAMDRSFINFAVSVSNGKHRPRTDPIDTNVAQFDGLDGEQEAAAVTDL